MLLRYTPRHGDLPGLRNVTGVSWQRGGLSASLTLSGLSPILEAAPPVAALTVSVDSGRGVLHADLGARDSLALDLMEAVRPEVDAYVLGILRSHTFAVRDFFETRQGMCRVLPSLTHRLGETQPTWAKAVAPVAERVMQALVKPEGRRGKKSERVPTLLTGANRSAGRDSVRRRVKAGRMEPVVSFPSACLECGILLDIPERSYCDECLPEQLNRTIVGVAAAGPKALADLRAQGKDPAHGGEAGHKRGRTNADHALAVAEWECNRAHDIGNVDFGRDILPGLRAVPLSRILEATGLSLRHCSVIRQGLKVPHPRHWERIKACLEEESDKTPGHRAAGNDSSSQIS